MYLRRRVKTVTIFLVAVVLIAVGRAAAQELAAGTKSAHGMLSGRVIFQGSPPQEEWVPVQKHRTFCGKKRPLGRHRVSPSGGVEHVAVLLDAETDGPSMPSHETATVSLDNRDCEFLPRVQVTRPSALLEVRNTDPILHSAHGYSQNGRTAFHVALPHFRDRTRVTLPEEGLLRIECDVGHNWMRAYILISSTPLTAVTGPEGTFEIANIPPGRYRLRAWHEAFGQIEREVSVSKGERTRLTLVLGTGNARGE